MSSNHKLSGVLRGRSIDNVAYENDVCTISLLDGAQMRIKLAPRVLANELQNESAPTAENRATADGNSTAAAAHEITAAVSRDEKAAPSCAAQTDSDAMSAPSVAATSANADDALSENAARGVVKGVRQSGTTLDFDLENGGTLSLQTREATSSVMLRDKNGALEYAD